MIAHDDLPEFLRNLWSLDLSYLQKEFSRYNLFKDLKMRLSWTTHLDSHYQGSRGMIS